MGDLESLETIFVVKHTGEDAEMKDGRDVWYHDALEAADDECEAEALDAEHPLYILYSSGSTAKPKGILHTTGGYLTHVAWTHKYVFDLKPDEDVWWCSADVGWVTGHSYIVYGPLMNGATSVMYEGAPDYPDKDIWWELCDRYGVTLFYTAPTAIRACIKWGAKYPERHDLSKLRLLGTVGEPINPKAWLWYWKVIGGERCPVVDTWWQTETGGIMITTLPGAQYAKPGSAGQPLPGIDAAIIDSDGNELTDEQDLLVLRRPWPGMLRTLYKDEDRFIETYFSRFGNENYLVGDAARKDSDDYFWIVGRVDDVINVSGHRLSTAEVESAIVAHGKVAEAAVVAHGRRGHRAGDRRLRDPGGRPRGLRRAGHRAARARRPAHRQARAPAAHHLVGRPAQDALGQDHAPAAARHRRGPRAGRRDDPARPGDHGRAQAEGRRAGRQRGLATDVTGGRSVVRDVILRDGAALRLRSPRPEDEADIKAFFDALAPESRYLRFHGLGRTDVVARDYAHADGDARVRCWPTSTGASSPSRATTASASPARPRSPSRSPTRCTAAAWPRGCSSSWPRSPPRGRSRASTPR